MDEIELMRVKDGIRIAGSRSVLVVFIGRWIAVLLLFGGVCHEALASDADGRSTDAATAANGVQTLALPARLQGVLIKEMLGLRQGVAEIAASLSTGDWDSTRRAAVAIRDSYIMRQTLTEGEMRALEKVLPARFAELDQRLHEHADALARAAVQRDPELSVFYYGKILDGCQECHRHYATKTLPGFAVPQSRGADSRSP